MSRRITRLYGKKTDRHVSNDGKTRTLKNYLRILGNSSFVCFANPSPDTHHTRFQCFMVKGLKNIQVGNSFSACAFSMPIGSGDDVIQKEPGVMLFLLFWHKREK